VQQPPASVNGRALPQGGTLVIRTAGNGAASASLAYRGGVFPMVRDGDAFWTVIPAGATATLGDSEAVTTLFDNAGQEAGTASELVSVVPTNWYVENIDLPPGVGVGIPPEDIQAEINIRAATFANFTFEKLWSGPFIYPVNGPITANFGDARSFNGGPVGNHHTGTDFGVDAGTPIGAAAHGRVVFIGNLATHGNCVIVDHGVGVFTTYNHMLQINAVVGQEVQPGDVLGLVGTTGLSTGPHLHWELVVGGIPVNPLAWTQPGGAP
jgi:murein DD-endopeptidase MepM/ murein hydrolase activator NlpD